MVFQIATAKGDISLKVAICELPLKYPCNITISNTVPAPLDGALNQWPPP